MLLPPERFTLTDAYRILLGVLCIPMGFIILYRTLTTALAPPPILIGLGFIGFGLYRLNTAWHRYRLYRANRRLK